MDSVRFVAPRSEGYIDWSEAYSRVENYFFSLQIKDKLLLSQLVAKILMRTAVALKSMPEETPSALALKEAHKEVSDWFEAVLRAAEVDTTAVEGQGRLALFLSDLPTRWQSEFLHPGPWPDDFLQAIRESYLHTGPDFQKSLMRPREIDLGPVSAIADETWRAIDRWPILGTVAVWTIYLGILGTIFYLTR
ncbi:hypothetical protein MLD52_11165 [Puniceicoccaceae bacterium K14]|nr:hypothetical protein [Puniceicoccaceae bacterium K14]